MADHTEGEAMKATKGPWKSLKIEDDELLDGTAERYDILGSGSPIASVFHDGLEWEEYEANARLIAACPELLEALKPIPDFLDRIAKYIPEDETALLELGEAIYEQAKAAIAKAEGEWKE